MTRETIISLAALVCIFGNAALSDTGFDTPVIGYPCGLTDEAMEQGIWGLRQAPGAQYAPSPVWRKERFDLIAWPVIGGDDTPRVTPVVDQPETSPVPLPAAIWGLLSATGGLVGLAWFKRKRA